MVAKSIITTFMLGIIVVASAVWNVPHVDDLQPITVQNVSQVQLLYTLDRDFTYVAAWSPDSHYLAVNASNTGVDLFDVVAGKLTFNRHFDAAYLGSVAFSPDGTQLAIGQTSDASIKIYDLKTGDVVLALDDDSSSTPAVTANTIAYSPDGRFIASGHSYRRIDRTLRLWDAKTGAMLLRIPLDVYQVLFSPDSKLLLGGVQNGTIRVWNIDHILAVPTGDVILEELVLNGYGPLAFVSNNIIYRTDDAIQLWDLKAEKVKSRIVDKNGDYWTRMPGNDGILFAVAVKNEQTGQFAIQLWDISRDTLLTELAGQATPVRILEFSSDNRFLLSTDDDGKLYVWGVPAN